MGLPQVNISIEDYLTLERKSPIRTEYYKGQTITMSGASLNHNFIVSNLFFLLQTLLYETDFQVFGSDLRLNIPDWDSFFYPDLMVVSGKPEVTLEDNLINPGIIVEVLSKSTKEKDRGLKFGLYRQIPTLKEYIMVSSEMVHVERYSKLETGDWVGSEATGLDNIITLPTYELKLPLSRMYKGTTFIVH